MFEEINTGQPLQVTVDVALLEFSYRVAEIAKGYAEEALAEHESKFGPNYTRRNRITRDAIIDDVEVAKKWEAALRYLNVHPRPIPRSIAVETEAAG